MRLALILAAAFAILVGPTPGAIAGTITAHANPQSGQLNLREAVSLATSGDTVELMPGRYDEFFVAQVEGGIREWEFVCFVQVPNLTIRSALTELATIGPEVSTPEFDGRLTAGIGIDVGATGLRVESVRMENTTWGISGVESYEVSNSRFGMFPSAGSALTVSDGDSARVADSFFESFGTATLLVGSTAGASITIERCDIKGRISTSAGSIFNRITIRDSRIVDGGAIAASGSVIEMHGCEVRRSYPNAPINLFGSRMLAVDCQFYVEEGPIAGVLDGGILEIQDSHCESASSLQLFHVVNSGLVIRDSNVLRGTGPYAVASIRDSLALPLSLTNNYWGTTDEAEIHAQILDAEELGDSTLVTAEILPIREHQVVEVEAESVGGIKAKFRR